ncbi:MAG: MBL fold metallo-hydrolase [Clostridia bacterium]|nr:MBL fold metallo-hydrolase [Clostridia bacterium]
MIKRILASLLAVLLLLFSFTSCDVSQFLNDLLTESTSESTTEQQEELQPPAPGSYFEAHFIDVGQADSALVICDGFTMLIDAGNPDDDDIIIDYLEQYNVTHLNYVIATHPHSDHYGAFTSVLSHVTIDTVYSPFNVTDVSGFNRFLNYVHYTKRNQVIVPEIGEQFYLGAARVTVLGPLRTDYEDINNTSIVLRIEYGDLAFLFAGDMEGEAELELIKTGVNLKADVIKVGHHGSYSSSWYQFLRAVQPTYGVISCGRNNEYGHPHESVLSRYRDADVKLYRTDMQGHIVCRSDDGKTLTFTTQMNPDANTNPTAAKEDTSYLPTYLYYEEQND